MTNDFKEKMLKWLTANYANENGSNEPQFGNVATATNELFAYLQTELGSFAITTILQGNNANNQGIGYSVLAGSYQSEESIEAGFLTILDENFTPLQTITHYTNGNIVDVFKVLGVGDDGNFFGITFGTNLFVMLNNILAKLPSAIEYTAIVKESYSAPTYLVYSDFSYIIKCPGKTNYFLAGTERGEGSSNFPLALEIQIENATANFTRYTYSGTEIGFYIKDFVATWDNNGNLISFKIPTFYPYETGTYFLYAEFVKNSSTLQLNTITSIAGSYFIADIIIINETTTYITLFDYNYQTLENDNFMIFKMDYDISNFKFVYSKLSPKGESPGVGGDPGVFIYKFNNEAFFRTVINKDSTPTAQLRYVGRIIGEEAYEKFIAETPLQVSLDLFMVQKQFNLYTFFTQAINTVYTTTQIYNPLNYNGLPYEALNSMIPNSGVLYDSNNIAIFARNLYNRTINNNTTISTIQVPNNFINDMTVLIQDLISETGNILVDNTREITKNIYEELLINFVNTLTIKNSNNPANEIINSVGAVRFNNSISNLKDYESCKISKMKINYSDDTSRIDLIDNSATTYGFDTNHYAIYSLPLIYVPYDKDIVNIQLISNDELTVFQTIDTSNLINSKYYRLNQKVEVI